MIQKVVKKIGTATLAALTCALSLSMTSCGLWEWLWTRDFGEPLDTDDMIIGSQSTPDETDSRFDGAVAYLGAGTAHDGTDIYYLGEKGSPNEHRIIVIDPGHQTEGSSELEPNGPGSNEMKAEVTWGATGVATGQTEYELNLKVALLLRDELIKRGYSVVMIRETNDVNISNMERAEIANKYDAEAYIRIHANSWTEEGMYGAMTICQTPKNPYPDCAAHYEESALLSKCILNKYCAQTNRKNLGVREMDNYTGTNWSRVPTTILEMGFLSNIIEDELMVKEIFQREAAIGVANGLDEYFALTDPVETTDEAESQAPAEP